MKKLIVTAIAVFASLNIWAQGQLNFVNRLVASGIDAPIRGVDNSLLQGPNYVADLFYGPVGADPSTFSNLGLAVAFRTGAAAGYLPATGVTLPFAVGTDVQVQIRAWNLSAGSTWAAASVNPLGEVSPIDSRNPAITVKLTGPPDAAAAMTGLVGHSLVPVPEPSTILLGLAGIGGLLFLRRKMA